MGAYARSGKNRSLTMVGETYGELRCDRRAVGIAQIPLAEVSTPCFQVLLQVDRNQAINVFVGSVHGCYIELVPGQSITISIDNASKVYVRAAAEGQFVNWLRLA